MIVRLLAHYSYVLYVKRMPPKTAYVYLPPYVFRMHTLIVQPYEIFLSMSYYTFTCGQVGVRKQYGSVRFISTPYVFSTGIRKTYAVRKTYAIRNTYAPSVLRMVSYIKRILIGHFQICTKTDRHTFVGCKRTFLVATSVFRMHILYTHGRTYNVQRTLNGRIITIYVCTVQLKAMRT